MWQAKRQYGPETKVGINLTSQVSNSTLTPNDINVCCRTISKFIL